MRKKYQSKERKSNHKFEVVRGQELLVRVPLPMCGCGPRCKHRWKELTGQAGLQILPCWKTKSRAGQTASTKSRSGLCALGKAAGLCSFCGTENPVGTATGTNARRPGSGTGELRSVAARRETATSGARTHGGWVVHAELSASGRECCRRLRDREKQREPAVRRGRQQSTAGAVRTAPRRFASGGVDDRWHSLWRSGVGGGFGHRGK